MPRGRRYLAALLVLILLAPSLGMLVWPYQDRSVMEHRRLARLPPLPVSAAAWAAWPGALDAYVRDHFAGRQPLIFADLLLNERARLKPVSAAETTVLQGDGDWLLLERGLTAATGGHVDARAAKRYAGFVCALAADMKARRTPFLFAPVPGAAEIYPEAVPDWVPKGPISQADLQLKAARDCGAPALDLRPALLAAKSQGKVYQHHDSHWTNIGAQVAFDGMMKGLGLPYALGPQPLTLVPRNTADSDLVRLSGLVGLKPELLPQPPEGADDRPRTGLISGVDHGVFPPAFLQPAQKGPTVLIVGDSYASDFMAHLFRRAGVRLAWIHQADCRFDRRIFDKVRPDAVILAPADRQEICR